MEVMFSKKNKKLFIINGFKYGFQKQLSGNMERWTCTKRKCKSFIKINTLNNIEECNLEHNHEKDSENILDRQALSNNLKRKAQENLERPTKLICQELLVNGDIEQLTELQRMMILE